MMVWSPPNEPEALMPTELSVRAVRETGMCLAQALDVAEKQLCPAWAMLKPGTPISTSFRVIEG
jgi:hypothetical protein